jgi:hypothetical protein
VRANRALTVHGRFAVLVGSHALEVLDLSPYSIGDYAKEVILPAAPAPAKHAAAKEHAPAAEPEPAPAAIATDAAAQPQSPAIAAFPGVSASGFSNEAIPAIKAALGCSDERARFYCDALDRFATAHAAAPDTRGYWSGTYWFAAASAAGVDPSRVEGAIHLLLAEGQGAFPFAHDADSSGLVALVQELRAGQLPSADSPMQPYVTARPAQHPAALQESAGSLSFSVPASDASGEAAVFVRENAEEMLAVAIWGEGHAVRVAVLPKKFASPVP